jgi:type IV secretion system protein VirB8
MDPDVCIDGAIRVCEWGFSLPHRLASDQRCQIRRNPGSGSDAGGAMSLRDRELDAYLHEATEWDLNRMLQLGRAERKAWAVAAAAAVCAIAASAALAMLTPLKRVEPFVIRVDNATGLIDVVPVYAGKAPMDESVTRYFLTHYVSVCERFYRSTAESDYQECGAFHNAQRNQAWYALWNPSNPLSPLNRHKDGSAIEVRITALSFFRRVNGVTDTAQIRYVKVERSASGAERDSHWIATVRYAYEPPSVDPTVRRWNPLGFKVLDFVAEAEVAADATESGQ